MHAVRSSTGDRMWAYTPGDRHLIWSPLLSPDGGSLYVMSSATGTIYAMRTRDGSMIGVSPGTGKEADGQVLSSPSLGLSGRILYVPTDKRTAIKAIDTCESLVVQHLSIQSCFIYGLQYPAVFPRSVGWVECR